MNKINLTEVFCEVMSGLALLITIIPLLDILKYSNLCDTISYISLNISLSNFGILIVVCYILGLLFDAIGLTIGELFLDNLVYKNLPSENEIKSFWQKITPHVLNYRDTQWAYYSCYRNLFIIFIPGTFLWTIVLWNSLHWYLGFLILIMFIILEFIFYFSMKVLLKIYYEITKSF